MIILTILLICAIIYFSGVFLAIWFHLIVDKNKEKNIFCRKMWKKLGFDYRREIVTESFFSWVAICVRTIQSFEVMGESFNESLLFYKWNIPCKVDYDRTLTLKAINDWLDKCDNDTIKQNVEVFPYRDTAFVIVVNGKAYRSYKSSTYLINCLKSDEFKEYVENTILVFKMKKLKV
jgi:hypothetical protein